MSKISTAKISQILLLITGFFLQSYLIKFKIGRFPTNLLEILIFIQFLLLLYQAIFEKHFFKYTKKILSSKIIPILLGLILFSLINFLIREIDLIIFIRNLRFIFSALVFTAAALIYFKTDKQQEKLLAIMGLGALSFGIFSLIYNLLGHNLTWDGRLLGPLDSAVYLAYYLTPFFLFFTISYLKTRSKKKLFLAILSALLIIATRSMGAIASSFIIIFIYLIWQQRETILKNKKILLSLAVGCLLIAASIFYLKILPTLNTKYSSLDERGQIWQTSTYLLKQPQTALFGLGLGQFEQNYIKNVRIILNGGEPLDYYVIQPHNIFLLFWFNFGLPGLIFILWIFITTFKKILSAKASKNSLAITSSFLLLYFLIHGLIDTPIFKNDLLLIFIFLLQNSLNPPERAADL